MQYDLFLFDLDDTLLNFKESEKLSFSLALQSLGIKSDLNELFRQYQIENTILWKLFEENKTTKDHLKVERFRKIFQANGIEVDPEVASKRYLDTLPETVVLMDHAVEVCEWLYPQGEIGIITNGIHYVQTLRIQNSQLAKYISFVSVSEEAGFAKPDVRFFDYSAKLAKKFSKASSLVIGDRMDADIQGAHNFGVDAVWFNHGNTTKPQHLSPKYEIKHLSEIKTLLSK